MNKRCNKRFYFFGFNGLVNTCRRESLFITVMIAVEWFLMIAQHVDAYEGGAVFFFVIRFFVV